MATAQTLYNPKTGVTATPNANVTAAQIAAAQSQGFVPSGRSFIDSGGQNFNITKGARGEDIYNKVNSITPDSLAPANAINLPTQNPLNDPGNAVVANNFGLASLLSGTHTLDANGQFVANPNDTSTEAGVNQSTMDSLRSMLGIIPQKENVMSSPEYTAANSVVEARRQEVNNATSILNGIVAKQQQDLISTRGTAGANGVTEAVYGGISATINREAALQALPVQAAVAAAQGNLQLAEQHLDTIYKMKSEEVQNNFDYRMKVYDSISGFVDKQDKIQLDNLRIQQEHAYQETQNLNEEQNTYAKMAMGTGQSQLGAQIAQLDYKSPTFKKDLARLQGQIKDPNFALDQKIKQENLNKLNADTKATSNLSVAQNELTKATGADGYTDPNLYARLRASSKTSPTEFDNRFAYLVNPASRAKLGLTATNAGDVGAISGADQTKGVNYLLTNGGTQDDLAKFSSDRAFQAWVLSKTQ